ncbi:MAG: hypothetical protein ACRDNW_08840 [Trebonia sp.]
MPGTEHDQDGQLPDISGLSLDDLSALDDSVVGEAIGRLLEYRYRYEPGEGPELFNNFNSGP